MTDLRDLALKSAKVYLEALDDDRTAKRRVEFEKRSSGVDANEYAHAKITAADAAVNLDQAEATMREMVRAALMVKT